MEALQRARRERDSLIHTAIASREDSTTRVYLERALEVAKLAEQLEAERVDALPACKMCGRKVTTPCNTAEGYFEGGPWDFACEDYAKGRAA